MSRTRTNIVLYLLVVLAACAALFLYLYQQQSDTDVADRVGHVTGTADDVAPPGVQFDASGEDLHTAVLQAAMAQAMAFINVDHNSVEASTEKVLAGATGEFAEQYKAGLESLTELTKQYESVMTGKVVSAGVVAADEENATVLVALEGTVTNTQSESVQANAPRLQLKLSYEDGKWLTNDLIFVP